VQATRAARFRCSGDVQKLAPNLTEKRRSASMKRDDERGTMSKETMNKETMKAGRRTLNENKSPLLSVRRSSLRLHRLS
jgi:hypothetical protein